MAIKFASSSLSSPESNLYSIEKFNGVDYTTTPTLVDDSRAIDISNYLPKGNSLVKRNGVTNVAKLTYESKEYVIHNIWETPKLEAECEFTNTTLHIVFASEKSEEGYINPKLLYVYDLLDVDRCEVKRTYEFNCSKTLSLKDLYSYGVYFEGRLFILCMNEYLFTDYEYDPLMADGYIEKVNIRPVKEVAYVPTVVIGLGRKGGTSKFSTHEEFNLLSNKCRIELLVETATGNNGTDKYDIGQFFSQEQELTLKNVFDCTEINNGYVIEGIGTVSYDEETRLVSLDKHIPDDNLDKLLYITLEFEFSQQEGKTINIVEKMRFGASYGSYGHRDRLFLSGNPEYPNLDIHTCETSDMLNPWLDYTYFGDLSYTTIGTSDSAITGYGFLNNGQMAIFKKSKGNQPNLYFRNYEMKARTDEVLNRTIYEEHFPVTISGLSLDIDVNNKIINYGNDLLVNTSKGVYKIMAGESTATQTYNSNEVSYYIRDNLGNNSEGAFIVYDNKLFIAREDNLGNKRVYVADSNRYSFVDGKQVYEWFILDGIEVESFFVFDNVLYFSNDKGLFKFNDNFDDMCYFVTSDIQVNGETISSEVFLNEETNRIILSSSNEEIQKILKKSDQFKSWKEFKEKTKIRLDSLHIPRYNDIVANIEVGEYSNERIITVPLSDDEDCMLTPILLANIVAQMNNDDYYVEYPSVLYNSKYYNVFRVEIEDDNYKIHCRENAECDSSEIDEDYIILALGGKEQHFRFGIDEMYYNNYPFSKCTLDDGQWYYVDEENEEVEQIGLEGEVCFNEFTLNLFGYPIDFEFYGQALKEVLIEFYTPVKSYWRSKFTALNRLDYLKTIDRLTFVADSKRGGDTRVGFRTSYKTMSAPASTVYGQADAKQILTVYKNNTVDTSLVRSTETSVIYKDLDFNDIDFANFSFSTSNFAKTQTMKKKVKNFSFVQIVFESDKNTDSTITSLVFRYKYTKNNKGVK